MTPQEAISLLVKRSRRDHKIAYATAGASHGDPGGWHYISDACSFFIHNSYGVTGYNLGQCNCGAQEANQEVREAESILRQLVQTAGKSTNG